MSSILMNNQIFNNEVPFCKITTLEAKTELEKRFLASSISYFADWQELPFLQRLFHRNKGKISCVIRINSADFSRAKEALIGMDGKDIKLQNPQGEREEDTVRILAQRKAAEHHGRKKLQPVIREVYERTEAAAEEDRDRGQYASFEEDQDERSYTAFKEDRN